MRRRKGKGKGGAHAVCAVPQNNGNKDTSGELKVCQKGEGREMGGKGKEKREKEGETETDSTASHESLPRG